MVIFMKKYLDILKLSKLFAGINENEIEDVLFCLSAKKRNYRKGEYVFRAGEHISSVALRGQRAYSARGLLGKS